MQSYGRPTRNCDVIRNVTTETVTRTNYLLHLWSERSRYFNIQQLNKYNIKLNHQNQQKHILRRLNKSSCFIIIITGRRPSNNATRRNNRRSYEAEPRFVPWAFCQTWKNFDDSYTSKEKQGNIRFLLCTNKWILLIYMLDKKYTYLCYISKFTMNG